MLDNALCLIYEQVAVRICLRFSAYKRYKNRVLSFVRSVNSVRDAVTTNQLSDCGLDLLRKLWISHVRPVFSVSAACFTHSPLSVSY